MIDNITENGLIVKNRIREYLVRFYDTSSILYDNYPSTLSLKPMIDYQFNVSLNKIENQFGEVYLNGVWATANVLYKPLNWVIKINKNHELWDKIESFLHRNLDYGLTDLALNEYVYFGNKYYGESLLEFEGHQYLTLEQFYALVMKEDNEKFENMKRHIEKISNLSDVYKIVSDIDGMVFFARGLSIDNDMLHTKFHCREDGKWRSINCDWGRIELIRSIEVAKYGEYKKAKKLNQELHHYTIGDWAFFWEDNCLPETEEDVIILTSILTDIVEDGFISSSGYKYSNCIPVIRTEKLKSQIRFILRDYGIEATKYKPGDKVITKGYSKRFDGQVLTIKDIFESLGIKYFSFYEAENEGQSASVSDIERYATKEEIDAVTINLNVLNQEDVFYILTIYGNAYLIKGFYFSGIILSSNKAYSHSLGSSYSGPIACKDEIDIIRPATEDEKAVFYVGYPELK